ncbi:hypothetical protein JX265_011500 [Neoarthrinium moseri]|uniref:Uncharacterized protein n=1 Tax=Neoarthrinium moseri TaxID=1658444 RepID=A0A9Q0AJI6_9PEZI|nr:uncharacterized protein JN550_008466 [Neoarthrinium moseri]KAI1848648.1 hypothetical protein JX266_005507 [Neoarthrinium moseri]KAI1856541.1 hypothetical protein JX265_011500 [Neoarthrinium moseri]KAI1865418.1 hypothetical protein JN550_008466 [Neoarthrinium moseri]
MSKSQYREVLYPLDFLRKVNPLQVKILATIRSHKEELLEHDAQSSLLKERSIEYRTIEAEYALTCLARMRSEAVAGWDLVQGMPMSTVNAELEKLGVDDMPDWALHDNQYRRGRLLLVLNKPASDTIDLKEKIRENDRILNGKRGFYELLRDVEARHKQLTNSRPLGTIPDADAIEECEDRIQKLNNSVAWREQYLESLKKAAQGELDQLKVAEDCLKDETDQKLEEWEVMNAFERDFGELRIQDWVPLE